MHSNGLISGKKGLRMFARVALAATLLIGTVLWHQPASAQEMNRIAAVVNDEIISTQELIGRMRLAMLYSGIQDSQEARQRVAPQVLRKLIDEHLQMQEAARLKITLSSAEVDNGIAMIEQQNRMPKGSFLSMVGRSGLDPQLAKDQVKADLTWMRLTSRVLTSQARVGDQEVNDRLDMIKDRQGKPEYLLSEISLPVDSPEQEEQAKVLGERLLEQLRSGAPFPVLARQFSRSPTAANGGSLGWQSQSTLDSDLVGVVNQMSRGQVSGLVRTGAGFVILRMDEERIAGEVVDPANSTTTLTQLTLPEPKAASPKEAPPVQVLMARAAQLTQPMKSCPEFEALGQKLGAVSVGGMGTKRIGELPGNIRPIVANLQVNQVSPPIDTPEGIQVLMVCAREDSVSVSMPSAEQVRRLLEDERLDMLSRRYIRNLRRAAFIDIRI